MIPRALFYVMEEAIDHVHAEAELTAAAAGQMGQLMAENGKAPGVRSAWRKLQARALPVLYDDEDEDDPDAPEADE